VILISWIKKQQQSNTEICMKFLILKNMCSVVKEVNVACINVEQAEKIKKNCYEISYQEVTLEGKNETKSILNLYASKSQYLWKRYD